jgi:hypothetical protein
MFDVLRRIKQRIQWSMQEINTLIAKIEGAA